MKFSVIIPFMDTMPTRLRAFQYVVAYALAQYKDAEIIVAEQDTNTPVPKGVKRVSTKLAQSLIVRLAVTPE